MKDVLQIVDDNPLPSVIRFSRRFWNTFVSWRCSRRITFTPTCPMILRELMHKIFDILAYMCAQQFPRFHFKATRCRLPKTRLFLHPVTSCRRDKIAVTSSIRHAERRHDPFLAGAPPVAISAGFPINNWNSIHAKRNNIRLADFTAAFVLHVINMPFIINTPTARQRLLLNQVFTKASDFMTALFGEWGLFEIILVLHSLC